MQRLRKFLRRFMSRKIQGQFRHLVNSIGAFLIGFSVFEEQQVLAVAGVLIAVFAFIASWRAPEKAEEPQEFYDES